jgi:hypothetical protein
LTAYDSKLLILNQQSKVWLILISLWIINGSSFLAIKVAIDTIPPLLSAGLRFSISGAILFTVYFFQTKRTEVICILLSKSKKILNTNMNITARY